MAEYDGDIKLHVDLDSKSILQSLNNIKKSVASALSGKETSDLDRNVQATNKSLQQTQKEFNKVQSEISKTETKLSELEARYDAIAKRGTLQPTKTNTQEYIGEFYTKSDAERLAVLGQQIENAYAKMGELRAESENFGESTASATKRATSATGGLRSAFDRLQSVVAKFGKKAVGALGSVSKAALNAAKNITNKLGSALVAPIQGIGNKLTGIFKKIGTSIRRVFIFSVITSAFRNLRSAINDLISSNTQLKASLTQIKSNLWTAFAPIYTKALPALNALMNALSKATGYIAAFFSALTGQSVSKSYNQAKNLHSQIGTEDKQKDAIDEQIKNINKQIRAIEKKKKAYEKAKKAEENANKKSLLSFDELNQISGPETEDAKLAAYETQIEALEEQLELLQDQKDAIEAAAKAADELVYPTYAEKAYDSMKNIVDMLKEAWSDGDFTEIGTKLKDAIVSQLNKIKWADIKINADKLGKSFATSLNGLITVDFGENIGKTIGEAFNAAVSAIAGFANSINASQLGRSLSTAIVNAVNTVDWNLVKKTAQTVGEKLADFINNAINPDSFGELGKAIGNGIQAAINFVYGFVTRIDATNLGKSFAALLNNAVKNIDFKKLGQTLFETVHKALQTLIAFLRDADWTSVGQAIADMIKSIDWGVLLQDVGTLIVEAIKAAIQLAAGALGFEVDDEAAGNIAKWITEAVGVGLAIAAIVKLVNTISGLLLPIFGKKDKALEKQTAKTAEETEAVTELSGAYQTTTAAAMAFTPALQGITSAGMSLIPTLQQVLQGNTALQPAMQGVTAEANAEGGALQNTATAANMAGAAYGNVAAGAQTVSQAVNASVNPLNQYSSAANAAGTSSTGFVNTVQTTMQTVAQTVMSAISGVISSISSMGSSFGGVASTISNYAQNISTSAQSAFDSAVNSIQSYISKIGSIGNATSTAATATHSSMNNIGKSVVEGTEEAQAGFEGLESGAENTSTRVLSLFDIMVLGIKSKLNEMTEALNSAFGKISGGMSNLSGMGTGAAGGLWGAIPIAIPALAQGAVIPPNREFMAVLGDQSSGTNVEAPLDTIKQAVAEVLGQGDFGGGNISINFNGDLAGLARILKPEISRERTRAGSSLIIGGNKV